VKKGILGVALVGAALSVAALMPSAASSAGSPPLVARVTLPDELAKIPSDVARLGAVPGLQTLHLVVTLAGQDPTGLADEVAAVSTPGSPDYRHYLTAGQYAAAYGPSPAEQWQVTSVLRTAGLTVGNAAPGSDLLPVSGSAAEVSSLLHTPLESVRLPGHVLSVVNTAAPQIPATLSHAVTGIIGLSGLSVEHSMLRHATSHAVAPTQTAGADAHDLAANAITPQACSGADLAAGPGGYTSTELADDYGLSQLFAQGRTGVGQTIGIVEFEQYSPNDIATFESCYGLDNPIRTVTVEGTPSGPASGSGESALDIELAAVNAPSASIIVYEAPNESSDVSSLDLLSRIASDDLAQTVTTSWGICEADNAAGDAQAEYSIFQRMAAQGQTMVAASGDTGSEDCYGTDGSTGLAVDDPGSQPDVISAGGTTLVDGQVGSQSVWNDCLNDNVGDQCQNNPGDGAGGGGYSTVWAKPAWQPGGGPGGREVPDLSGSADPERGVAAYYADGGGWTVFGGTSAVAPLTAALFADTNQGCSADVGMVGPALYAADNGSTFNDVTSGSNDFTGTNGGDYEATPGDDPASGLGTPQDQNLAITLQGGDGCPSVADLSVHSGPVDGSGALTITGGGLADASAVNFGSAGEGQILSQSVTSLTVVPPSPGGPVCVNVTVTNPRGISEVTPQDGYTFGGTGNCDGYRFVASDGGIFDYGSAAFEGSTGNISLKAPIVGMATTPSGNGYWLVASDGGIFSFGDANYYGSMGGQHLNSPIVGMAATPNGNGYWLVAADGGIFTFGGARFWGSTGNIRLNRPIVGMAPTTDGGGYWLVASDGGIFTFGDAGYHGSAGDIALNSPIVGMAATLSGNGYWLVASDGGIFTFGDAGYHGSMGAVHLNEPIVGLARTPDSNGYWLVASDGGIFSFGDAQFYGSTGSIHLNRPIVGMAAA
jgi:hypothetical protein